MKLAIYPGSFDPVTCGHLQIVSRAAALFDKVLVVVMANQNKQPLFTMEERAELLRRATRDIPGVEVDCYSGLLAQYAREKQAGVIVKGLRALSDFEYEFQMALTNRKLNPSLETVFLTTGAEYMYLSSSLVKQVAKLGGDIREFVPACIVDDILQKYGRNEKV